MGANVTLEKKSIFVPFGYKKKDKDTKILSEIFVQKIAADKFGGESIKTGKLYLFNLWIVSVLAMLTNSVGVLVRMFRKGIFPWESLIKFNLKEFVTIWKKTAWEMGRDPTHISSFFVDRFSRYNHQAKWGAAGWRSLDVFYNYWDKIEGNLKDNWEGKLTRYWIEKMENRQAVTNRLKIAIDLITSALSEFSDATEIRILSVASGSAQAVIGAMQQLPQLNIKATLIDFDQTALDEAKKSIEVAGLIDHFTIIHSKTGVLEKVCQSFQPHVVEMVGFLDYRSDKKAIDLIGRIKKVLPNGGIFITCNIQNNPEKIFLDWVLLWPMIYRSPEELGGIIAEAGFRKRDISLFYEPFEIHGIAVAVK